MADLIFLLAGTVGRAQFGSAGLEVTTAVSGRISSAGATTTAVVLYRGGAIGATEATIAVLVAAAASIVGKAGLTLASPNRGFAYRVAVWSLA